MVKIKFKQVKHRQDYLSVDKTTAISAHGEIFSIGDLVKHDEEEAGTATIKFFEFDYKSNDVVANTEKGWTRICFISKVNQEEV